MIPIARPESMKIAKLGAAVLAVFFLAAWRVWGAMTESPAPPAGKSVAMGGAATSPARITVSPTVLARSSARATPTCENPFQPFAEETASPDAPKPSPLAGSLAPMPAAAPLPTGSVVVAPRPGAAEAAPSSPPMRLTGVVTGKRPTAVVMIGEDEIVVRPGSVLPDGSTLLRIDATSATFARSGHRSVLQVAQ